MTRARITGMESVFTCRDGSKRMGVGSWSRHLRVDIWLERFWLVWIRQDGVGYIRSQLYGDGLALAGMAPSDQDVFSVKTTSISRDAFGLGHIGLEDSVSVSCWFYRQVTVRVVLIDNFGSTSRSRLGSSSSFTYFKTSPYKDEREVPKGTPMDALKCRIPPFARDGDIESYLDLDMKVLACFDYLNSKKVKMVTYEFIGKKRHANTWVDLKRELRLNFVPASHTKNLKNMLQRMYQGSKSVKDYHKDIEVARTTTNVLESNIATMAHFIHGLNRCSGHSGAVPLCLFG
ncbi:hypothetical protein CR513_42113, partial [Mucuna pruriens]